MGEGKAEKVQPALVRGYKAKSASYELSARNAMLYALGLGYSRDPLDAADLDFTYELAENFRVLPTVAAVFYPLDLAFEALRECPGLPDFNPMMLLHGEEMLKLHRPLRPDHTYHIESEFADVQDKGKGALVVVRLSIFEDKELKSLAVEVLLTLFIRGIGGYEAGKDGKGEKPKTYISIPRAPKGEPTATLSQKTEANQAVLYRLSGDYNPLHVDPSMAAMGGFEKPILHGLCSYGIVGKLLAAHFLHNDVARFDSMAARFTSHVFPGDTIVVKAWKTSDTAIVFSASTKERGLEIAVGELRLKAELKPKL